MWRCGVVFVCVQQNCDDQCCDICGFVYYDVVGKVMYVGFVKDVIICEEVVVLDLVYYGCVVDQYLQCGKQYYKVKIDMFYIGVYDQGWCDDCKGYLEGKEKNFGQSV